MERVTFPGAEALDEHELRGSIVTRATRCRSFLLEPFCLIVGWRALLDEHFLDREALVADELRLRLRYYGRGFRETEVTSETRPRGRGVEVVFRISEGPPTLLERVQVEQTKEVLSGREIRRARLPREGEPLDLIRLSEGLADLGRRLGHAGYLDHELLDAVTVSTEGLRATLEIEIDPGRRSTVGELDIRGNEDVTDRTIAEGLRLREGHVLRERHIAASQRSLFESNLFHEARVRVPEQPDSAKRVEVTVREAAPRSARLGAGFNTVDFLQAEGAFTHHNWFGRGRRLNLNLTVANLLAEQLNGRVLFRDVLPSGPTDRARPFLLPTWQASADVRQPGFLAAANVLAFGAFAHRRTIPGIVVDDGYGGEISFTRRFDYPVPVSAGYRLEMSGVSAGDLYFCIHYAICDAPTILALAEPHRLSPVSLNLSGTTADDPIGPTTGWRAHLDLEHASAVTQSDFGYHRVAGAGSRYLPLDVDRRRVLAGRLRAGWVHALSGPAVAPPLDRLESGLALDEELPAMLHPRKRFYSGGARSVRGYAENQLGPRILTVDPDLLLEHDPECAPAELGIGACDPTGVPGEGFLPRPVGGRTVLEGNVEYRFPLTRTLQGAVFVDGAVVGSRIRRIWGEGTAALTPGVGGRYRTPIGPVRVDLGYQPRRREELPVVTEFLDEDGVRHLVRLEQPRVYDPLEGAGFVDQILGRLTLHISIGEAF